MPVQQNHLYHNSQRDNTLNWLLFLFIHGSQQIQIQFFIVGA